MKGKYKRKEYNRICKVCAKHFISKSYNALYCSFLCNSRNRKRKEYGKECIACNKEYITTNKNQKFCDIQCFNNYKSKLNIQGNNKCTKHKLYSKKCSRCECAYIGTSRSNNCSSCSKIKNIERAKEHYRSKSGDIDNYLKRLLFRKCRNNISFTELKKLYESQNGKCNLTGWDMSCSTLEGGSDFNISIDKIDPSKEYIISNIQLVCKIVNSFKGAYNNDLFIKACKAVSNKYS